VPPQVDAPLLPIVPPADTVIPAPILPPPPQTVTQAGREVRPPSRFQDFVAFEAFVCNGVIADTLVNEHEELPVVQRAYAYSASTDPDTL
jgi:hypothetical protein